MKSKPYKGKRPDLKCTHCHNLGHTIGRCWALHPELKPDFDKEKGPQRGYDKRAHAHAHAAACTTGKLCQNDATNFSTNPAALLSDFATYLKEKGDTSSGDSSTSDSTALLGKFAAPAVIENSPALPMSSNEETVSPIDSESANSNDSNSGDSTSPPTADNALPADILPSISDVQGTIIANCDNDIRNEQTTSDDQKQCTPSQLALAWVHHQGDGACPIPGTTKIENFNQNFFVYIQDFRNSPPFILESYMKAWCHVCYLAADCGFQMPLKCSEIMEVCTPSKVNKCLCYLIQLCYKKVVFLSSIVICNFTKYNLFERAICDHELIEG
ncbi:hypothetical protein DKX38_021423 [Salix brachista]|uniref:Uncharacterized protein n=1 Tax=Salix brachista TaxID=2182728 RepID=A0A5N5K988_9ROSI|nr:hypothetical protein DKX38_021423 [Salix brachista]